MKKSTKIILPALAVLVLGTAATATGTVAWFASNNVVDATGMQVKCATSKNLIIANGTGTSDQKGTSVASKVTDVTLLTPASTADSKFDSDDRLYTYYAFTNDTKGKIDAITGLPMAGAEFADTTSTTEGHSVASGTYYAKHQFWFNAQSPSAMESFSITGATVTYTDKSGATQTAQANITKCLRMGLYYTDGTTTVSKIFTFDSTASTYNAITAAGVVGTVADDGTLSSNATPAVTMTTSQTAAAWSTVVGTSLGTVPANVWTEMDIFFWYEGQDANCTTANAVSVQGVNVALEFTAN